jgi:DNA-binding transcriptional LysR family regulator
LLDQQLGVVMLEEMRAFVVLADSGSLQRAAERLFLTPSAVTRQIQRLEAALKTPLLDRRVKPARITREGRAVLERGRQMLPSCADATSTCTTMRRRPASPSSTSPRRGSTSAREIPLDA